jgi:hypothetical protein
MLESYEKAYIIKNSNETLTTKPTKDKILIRNDVDLNSIIQN